jgi:hypothetical protein
MGMAERHGKLHREREKRAARPKPQSCSDPNHGGRPSPSPRYYRSHGVIVM